MTRRLSGLAIVPILATVLLVLLAPTGARGVVSSTTGPPLGGVNATGLTYGATPARVKQEIAWARSLHAHAIRVEIPWATLEPTQGQIEPKALAFTDSVVNQAAAAGIKVVALTMWTPCWASSAPTPLLSKCRAGNGGRAQAWPPVNPASYGSFAAFVAARYGSKLAAVEVWNEPDQSNEDYFAGPNKAQRYAELLRVAYPAIKSADPQMTVLGGSLVGTNGAFLRALYANGIKGYYDGLSVHFYTLALGAMRYTHEVQLHNGDHTPLWLNEFGWSSCWPGQRIQQEQGCVTQQAQATNIANVYRETARTPWIAAEMLYSLQGSRSEDFGVLNENGRRKPAFAALRGVFVSPFGKSTPVTVHLSRGGGGIVASGSGPVGDYLQLEAFKGTRAVYRAQFTLDRFNRYSIALPRVLGTKLRVSVFQYWLGTARAASASI
jgi:polysaccharide biosynthesis protein PslG